MTFTSPGTDSDSNITCRGENFTHFTVCFWKLSNVSADKNSTHTHRDLCSWIYLFVFKHCSFLCMKQHFRHHNKFQTLTQEKYFVKCNLYIQETIDYIEVLKTALKIIHSILILVSLFFNYLIESKSKTCLSWLLWSDGTSGNCFWMDPKWKTAVRTPFVRLDQNLDCFLIQRFVVS